MPYCRGKKRYNIIQTHGRCIYFLFISLLEIHFAQTFYFFDAKATIEMPQRAENTTSTRERDTSRSCYRIKLNHTSRLPEYGSEESPSCKNDINVLTEYLFIIDVRSNVSLAIHVLRFYRIFISTPRHYYFMCRFFHQYYVEFISSHKMDYPGKSELLWPIFLHEKTLNEKHSIWNICKSHIALKNYVIFK